MPDNFLNIVTKKAHESCLTSLSRKGFTEGILQYLDLSLFNTIASVLTQITNTRFVYTGSIHEDQNSFLIDFKSSDRVDLITMTVSHNEQLAEQGFDFSGLNEKLYEMIYNADEKKQEKKKEVTEKVESLVETIVVEQEKEVKEEKKKNTAKKKKTKALANTLDKMLSGLKEEETKKKTKKKKVEETALSALDEEIARAKEDLKEQQRQKKVKDLNKILDNI